jgi:hypothetical protein
MYEKVVAFLNDITNEGDFCPFCKADLYNDGQHSSDCRIKALSDWVDREWRSRAGYS